MKPLKGTKTHQNLKDAFAGESTDLEVLQRAVRKAAGKYVADQTRRRPMIVPVVMEA